MKLALLAARAGAFVLVGVSTALASPDAASTAGPMPTSPPFRIVARPLTPRDLQVVVLAQPDLRAPEDRSSASSFAKLLRRQFKQSGFKGDICLLTAAEQPSPELPRLEIRLTEWNVLPGREVDCQFDAALFTHDQRTDLGVFGGKAVDLDLLRNRRAQAQEFKEAAVDAIAHLYDQLRQQNLLSHST